MNEARATVARGGASQPDFPVNVYHGRNRLIVTAPLPGVEPDDIHIHVDGRLVALHVDLRGPRQQQATKYLRREWTTGPGSRVVDLPIWVDAAKANATYDNGVLVLILPIAPAATAGTVSMIKVGTAKGQAIGHVGHTFHLSPSNPGLATRIATRR